MILAGRRRVLHLAGLAIALPLVSVTSAAARPAGRFAPSTQPMLYTRRLERALAGGAKLTVTRGFAVRFVRDGDGYRVEGEQVSVEVEAPAQLAALARLERERVETALFPLLLDSAGGIRGAARAGQGAQLDEAVREVEARIERGHHSPAEREELRAFVEAIHDSAGELLTELPNDLFAPGDSPREDSRAIALPDGAAGHVRTRFTATRDPLTGVMRDARREVVTEVAGERRLTVESWSLAPLKL